MNLGNLFITGATGYLGRNFLLQYAPSFTSIFALIRENSKIHNLKSLPNIKFIKLNELKDLNINFDFVLHMATNYGRSGESEKEVSIVNYEIPKEIFTSLSPLTKRWINIDTSLPPMVNHYSKSKNQFLLFLKEQNKTPVTSLVLQQLYGPHDGTFISFLMNNLINQAPYVEMTNGQQQRDFIYIEDTISAIFNILKIKNSSQFEYFDIGSGTTYSIREVVKILQELTQNTTTKFLWGQKPDRQNEPQTLCADMTKLDSIGHKNQFDLRTGLEISYHQMKR